MPKLVNKKFERFCREYVHDHNATRAAAAVGFSKKTAGQQGSRLLKNVKVQARIAELEAEVNSKVAEKTAITKEWAAEKYRQFVEFDPRKMFNDEGKTKPIHELDDETALAITSFDVDVEVSHPPKDGGGERGPAVIHEFVSKVKAADKKGALDSLCKLMGFVVEKHEHTGKDGKPIETKDVSDLETARRVAFLLEKGKRELQEQQEKPI